MPNEDRPIPDRLRESVGELSDQELLLIRTYREAGEKRRQTVQALLFAFTEKPEDNDQRQNM